MVGGSGTNKEQIHTRTISHTDVQKIRPVLSKVDHTLHQIAGGTSKKAVTKKTATTKTEAAKTIPLDDNKGNDELKEFNS